MKDGGPAYPQPNGWQNIEAPGMTLLQHYAGLAMQEMIGLKQVIHPYELAMAALEQAQYMIDAQIKVGMLKAQEED